MYPVRVNSAVWYGALDCRVYGYGCTGAPPRSLVHKLNMTRNPFPVWLVVALTAIFCSFCVFTIGTNEEPGLYQSKLLVFGVVVVFCWHRVSLAQPWVRARVLRALAKIYQRAIQLKKKIHLPASLFLGFLLVALCISLIEMGSWDGFLVILIACLASSILYWLAPCLKKYTTKLASKAARLFVVVIAFSLLLLLIHAYLCVTGTYLNGWLPSVLVENIIFIKVITI